MDELVFESCDSTRATVCEQEGSGKVDAKALPEHLVDSLLKVGVRAHQCSRLLEARDLYERVLSLQPDNFNALHLLGVVLHQLGDSGLAIEYIGKALEMNYESAPAHNNMGVALKALKRLSEAITSYDRALALNPDYAEAYSNRGNAFRELKSLNEALDNLDRALELQPHNSEAHNNRGAVMAELERLDEALACYNRAIELNPRYVEAQFNCSNVLMLLKRSDEALQFLERTLELKPDHAEAHYSKGMVLADLRRFEDAQDCYDEAVRLVPSFAEAHICKAMLLLQTGRYTEGWELYEWRWKQNGFLNRAFSQPLWLGEKDISGKTVLLHSEQGLGDTLQFCRYASLVSGLGARVLLEVRKPLLHLMERLPGVSQVLEQGQPLPEFDYHCPLMSLPLAFKTTLADIPSPQPYLSSEPERVAAWQRRLGPRLGKLRVGLVWSGSTGNKSDPDRSLLLEQLWEHLPDTCEYISLQKEVRERDRSALARSRIRHFEEEHQDFTDSAAICDLVDLVISVDTSGAHLAAAMGRPTWVLLSHRADWRWLHDREDSPWYASVRLYRQGPDRLWGPVLQRVGAALSVLSDQACQHRCTNPQDIDFSGQTESIAHSCI